jgi:hypothetical protein
MKNIVITTIDPSILLWSQALMIWSIATYGTRLDPFSDENADFNMKRWAAVLLLRIGLIGIVVYAISNSGILACFLGVGTLLQGLLRCTVLPKWVAETEIGSIAAIAVGSLAIIKSSALKSSYPFTATITPEHLSAACFTIAIFVFAIRGGTYIVRGYLKKAGTLPRVKPDAILIDVQEFNRGRLIGNLERIILTIVVAVGSFGALGFLIAAKGLVRFEEMKRDFAEYFLIGSLASVLVALLAGLTIRFIVALLWPELLSLQLLIPGS